MNAKVRAPGGGRKKAARLDLVGDPELKQARPPEELRDDNAKKAWKQIAKILIDKNQLSRDFFHQLTIYCNTYSLYLYAEREIEKHGLYTETADGGLKKHPAVNVRNDCVSQLRQQSSSFGLDPLAQLRFLSGGTDKELQTNEFDEF